MPEFTVQSLLTTPCVAVQDVGCSGGHRHPDAEEHASATHLVFPYRGAFVRHLGRDEAVAEANQVLFFNAFEGYRVSHPVPGGDASLDLVVDEATLRELAPSALLKDGADLEFRVQRLRIDPRAQALVALLRHGLHAGIAEPLEAESVALTLVGRGLGPRSARAARGSFARRRLVDRAKLVLAADLSRRWTLAEGLPATVAWYREHRAWWEGLPLYRYQLHLRLARALDLLGTYEDLSALSLDLGFSSHSHFSAAFQRTYGRTPSEFRRSLQRCTPAAPDR